MLHNKRRKSKGENHANFKDLHARNDARQDTGSLNFVLSALHEIQVKAQSSKFKVLRTCILRSDVQSAFLRMKVGTSRSSTRGVPIIGRGRSSVGLGT